MTPYEQGFVRGYDWAEDDMRNGAGLDGEAQAIRDAAVSLLRNVPRSAAGRRYIAEELGAARGYRFMVGRYVTGQVSRQTFDTVQR